MRSRMVLLVALSLLSSARLAPGQTHEHNTGYALTLRILPNASDETLAHIAEYAEPSEYMPSGNDTYKDIVRRRYGVFNRQIRTLVQRFNPQLRSWHAKPKGVVVLPAGPVWKFDVSSTLPKGSTVSQELVLREGSAGHYNLPKFLAANPKVVGMLDRLPAGLKLMLPWVSRIVSFRLKPEYVSRRFEIEQSLNRMKGVLDARISEQGRQVPTYARGKAESLKAVMQPSSVTTPSWPYTSWLSDARRLPLLRRNTAVVAVLDSGIPKVGGKSPIAKTALWTNHGEIPNNGKDDDDNIYIDDVYGCNLLSGGVWGFPVDDDVEGDSPYHGTQIAGLLTGALLPEDLRKEVQDSVHLMALKVLDSKGHLEIGAMANAIVYAIDKQANIINMSLRMPGRDASIERHIQAAINSNILFVVAAGNEQPHGLDLDEEDVPIYPAKYSLKYPDNVLTVAADDTQGQLATFSHWGKATVDLAAPGVDIESVTPDGKRVVVSGTSQATAVVSLAAALLHVEGVIDPADIKRRLLASVDYRPGLKDKVQSEGQLNIAKVLAINHDVVQLNSGELVIGKLRNRDPLQLIALSSPLNFGEVERIVFNYSNGEDLILTFDQKHGRRRFEQKLDIFPISIMVNGAVRKIGRDEARDLVPRYFRD